MGESWGSHGVNGMELFVRHEALSCHRPSSRYACARSNVGTAAEAAAAAALDAEDEEGSVKVAPAVDAAEALGPPWV